MKKTVAAELVSGHFLRFDVEGSVLRMYLNGKRQFDWSLRNPDNYGRFLVALLDRGSVPEEAIKIAQVIMIVNNQFVEVISEQEAFGTSQEG